MNEELVGLTEFDDESIRNAQAQLLKFGEIAGTNFERALKAAADFAAFTGTDLPTAAQAIGTSPRRYPDWHTLQHHLEEATDGQC